MNMNLWQLLSSPERVALVRAVVFSNGPITVTRVSKACDVSKALASNHLRLLCRAGVVKRSGGRAYEVSDGPGTTGLRLLFNLSAWEPSVFKGFDFVRGVGLYGSHAHGSNSEDSDIDVYVLVDETDDISMARLSKGLKTRFGEGIRLLFLTPEKLGRLRKEDALFYHSLVFGSLRIYGDGIE